MPYQKWKRKSSKRIIFKHQRFAVRLYKQVTDIAKDFRWLTEWSLGRLCKPVADLESGSVLVSDWLKIHGSLSPRPTYRGDEMSSLLILFSRMSWLAESYIRVTERDNNSCIWLLFFYALLSPFKGKEYLNITVSIIKLRPIKNMDKCSLIFGVLFFLKILVKRVKGHRTFFSNWC